MSEWSTVTKRSLEEQRPEAFAKGNGPVEVGAEVWAEVELRVVPSHPGQVGEVVPSTS